jgi:AraC-like DNA-binding protein
MGLIQITRSAAGRASQTAPNAKTELNESNAQAGIDSVGDNAPGRRPGRVRTMIAQRKSAVEPQPGREVRIAPVRARSVTDQVIDYIEANYSAPISLRDVALALGYSPCHLTHTFRESTGTPITAWIIKRRIVAAQRLLGESNANVAATAEAVGFNDLCYFTRQFVRHVGMTPGRFRAAMNGGRVPGGESGMRAPYLKGVSV